MSISLESVGSLQLQLGISSAFINIIQFDFRGSVVNSRKTDFDEHIFSSAENKHTNKKVLQLIFHVKSLAFNFIAFHLTIPETHKE